MCILVIVSFRDVFKNEKVKWKEIGQARGGRGVLRAQSTKNEKLLPGKEVT